MTAPESDDERRAKGLPPEPVVPGDDLQRPEPPKPVQTSFWLWVASGIVFVFGYLWLFLHRAQLADTVIKETTNPAASPDKIRSGLTEALIVILIGAVCYAGIELLFAWKARQGTRSARTVLVWLVVASLLFQLGLGFYHEITLIGTLIGLVGLLLMFLPKVTSYYPKVKRTR